MVGQKSLRVCSKCRMHKNIPTEYPDSTGFGKKAKEYSGGTVQYAANVEWIIAGGTPTTMPGIHFADDTEMDARRAISNHKKFTGRHGRLAHGANQVIRRPEKFV